MKIEIKVRGNGIHDYAVVNVEDVEERYLDILGAIVKVTDAYTDEQVETA